MANPTLSTSPETEPRRPRPLTEFAPSEMRPDEPVLARWIGMFGLTATVFGFMVVTITIASGPRWIPIWMGIIAAALGLGGLLFHAAQDGEQQIRRLYTAVAYALMLFGLVTLGGGLVDAFPLAGIGKIAFLPWGLLALTLALPLAVAPARHEDDPSWLARTRTAILVVGAVLAVLALGGGVLFSPPKEGSPTTFLFNPGLLLALYGLLYLSVAVIQNGAEDGLGYRLALALGGVGLALILYGTLRPIGAWLVYDQFEWFAGRAKSFFIPYGLVLSLIGLIYLSVSAAFVSEHPVILIARREVATFYYSPIAYCVMFGLLVIGGAQFVRFLLTFPTDGEVEEPIIMFFIIDFLPVLSVLFVVPILTMKLFSEERRTGSLELMLTNPISETALVIGKFAGVLILFLAVYTLMALYLVIFRIFEGPFDYRPLISFSVALISTGSSFLALGMFFSSLTKNQIISAALTFMGMMILFGIFLLARMVPPEGLKQLFRHLSFLDLWMEAAQGRLWVRDLLLHLSQTVFWLFATVKVLEARKWT